MVFEMKRISSTIFYNIKVIGLEWNLLIANHNMPKYWKYCTNNAPLAKRTPLGKGQAGNLGPRQDKGLSL